MIYLIRHGQDDETYIGGWSDVGLLKEGEEEVKESAKWIQIYTLRKFIVVISKEQNKHQK